MGAEQGGHKNHQRGFGTARDRAAHERRRLIDSLMPRRSKDDWSVVCVIFQAASNDDVFASHSHATTEELM
jgi:hypothetical protein